MANHNQKQATFCKKKKQQQHEMPVHPLLRKYMALEPAEPWISAMASVNTIVSRGIKENKLLIFSGGPSGVTLYDGHDDIWNPKGDCRIRLDERDLSFDSKVIFETRSRTLISLLSECACDEGTHYRFKLPPHGPELARIDKHNLGVRNFIASIMRKPIIGNTLVSALQGLQGIVECVYRLQNEPETAVDYVRDYVQEMGLDNCTNRPADVGKFLAWTETTFWARAFVETFAHCVGMLNAGVLDQASLADVSPTTLALLEQSATQMRYGVAAAQVAMVNFGFDTAVLDAYSGDHTGIKQSIRAFHDFLSQHYTRLFRSWPPSVNQSSGQWLTRSVVQRLQQDFGELYDMLVDSHDGLIDPFGGMLDRNQFFAAWNHEHGFNALPRADTKAPALVETMSADEEQLTPTRNRSSLIPALQKQRQKKQELHRIYALATNGEGHVSDFCKSFLNHEASTRFNDMNTHDGRLGRWLVVHCMMQLLSRLAVDIQGLRHRVGVEYFLHADLDGTPPWDPDKFPGAIRPAGPQYSWAALLAMAARQQRGNAFANVAQYGGGGEEGPRAISQNVPVGVSRSTPHGTAHESPQNTQQVPKKKGRFQVVHLPDGRVMLKDADGHVIFR